MTWQTFSHHLHSRKLWNHDYLRESINNKVILTVTFNLKYQSSHQNEHNSQSRKYLFLGENQARDSLSKSVTLIEICYNPLSKEEEKYLVKRKFKKLHKLILKTAHLYPWQLKTSVPVLLHAEVLDFDWFSPWDLCGHF